MANKINFADRIKTETVFIEELGEYFTLRTVTYNQMQQEKKDESVDSLLLQLCLSIIDPDTGQPIYNYAEDKENLGCLSLGAMNSLSAAYARVNGISKEKTEEIAKNLEASLNTDSVLS